MMMYPFPRFDLIWACVCERERERESREGRREGIVFVFEFLLEKKMHRTTKHGRGTRETQDERQRVNLVNLFLSLVSFYSLMCVLFLKCLSLFILFLFRTDAAFSMIHDDRELHSSSTTFTFMAAEQDDGRIECIQLQKEVQAET